jgi:hypothetical protein
MTTLDATPAYDLLRRRPMPDAPGRKARRLIDEKLAAAG